MELEVKLRVYFVKRLRTYFLQERPKKLVIYFKIMEAKKLLKCYMELEGELRIYLVKRLRTYFLHISSRSRGIYFKIIEVENLLRCHTYEAKDVSDLLEEHGGGKFT